MSMRDDNISPGIWAAGWFACGFNVAVALHLIFGPM